MERQICETGADLHSVLTEQIKWSIKLESSLGEEREKELHLCRFCKDG